MKTAIIGPGVMGKAILCKMLESGKYSKSDIWVSGPSESVVNEISEKFEVNGCIDNGRACSNADIVILAVKPQKFGKAADSISGKFPADALVLSIIAGVSVKQLEDHLQTQNVIRAMPNTASQIGKGISVWTHSEQVNEQHHAIAQEFLQLLGVELFVEDESYLDMATALSGTGPAYVFLFMEAMIDAGVHLGLPRRIAEQLVVQTISGSVEFYVRNQSHPAFLRNQVTSPGGTSAEALYYLEKAGFRTAISRAIWAAYERSMSLGKVNDSKIDLFKNERKD